MQSNMDIQQTRAHTVARSGLTIRNGSVWRMCGNSSRAECNSLTSVRIMHSMRLGDSLPEIRSMLSDLLSCAKERDPVREPK